MEAQRHCLRLWLRNFQVFANLLSEEIVDLPVTRNRGCFPGSTVDVNTVTAALAEELDTMTLKMTDQVDPLHEMEARGSRITVLFRRDSSASARFDSKTSWTAS